MRAEPDIAVHGVEGVPGLELPEEGDQLTLHAGEHLAHHSSHLLSHLSKTKISEVQLFKIFISRNYLCVVVDLYFEAEATFFQLCYVCVCII